MSILERLNSQFDSYANQDIVETDIGRFRRTGRMQPSSLAYSNRLSPEVLREFTSGTPKLESTAKSR